MNVEREYEYKPNWLMIVLCFLICLVTSVALGWQAYFNDRGLVFRGVELGMSAATNVYWLMCACCAFGLVCASGMAYVRMTMTRHVVFSPEAIVFPKSAWSSQEINLPFDQIDRLTAKEVNGQRFLDIYRVDGKKFSLLGSHLPTKRDFDEVCGLLAERIGGRSA